MIRTGRHPRIRIEHPRMPEPSSVTLWAVLEGKREDVVSIAMTEEQLYELAGEAIKTAAILRRQRIEATRYTRSIP